MLFEALKPRRLNMSPAVFDAPPPSPACSVIPGTLRSASLSVVTACCSITARGMTSIVCGISRIGTTYFGDDTTAVGAVPVTWTDSACVRISSDGAVRRLHAEGDARADEQFFERALDGEEALDAGRVNGADRFEREPHLDPGDRLEACSAPRRAGPPGCRSDAAAAPGPRRCRRIASGLKRRPLNSDRRSTVATTDSRPPAV